MRNNVRRSFVWKVRGWLGNKCNRLALRLLDPHDRWMIDYFDDCGHAYCQVIEGTYSLARSWAREHRGKIVGWNVSKPIPAQNGDGDGKE